MKRFHRVEILLRGLRRIGVTFPDPADCLGKRDLAVNGKIITIARQTAPITAITPVKISAPPCAKAQPPAKSAAQTAIVRHHSEMPKCKDSSLRLRTFERESDFRRIRPPNF